MTTNNVPSEPPTCSFTINQQTPEDDLPLDIKTILDMSKTYTELFMNEYGQSSREKNVWLIQLITISGAIFGGFILSQNPIEIIVRIGLLLLFIVIIIGLFFIYQENKNQLITIKLAYAKNVDYWSRVITYQDLIKRQNTLNEKERETRKQIEDYFKAFVEEIGILKEDGSLGNLCEKIAEENKRSWKDRNYILIFGFFLSVLIILFPNCFKFIEIL